MAADSPLGRTDGRWLVYTVLIAAMAFVLGVIGLAIYLPGDQLYLDLAYHSLQLFVLGSDPLQGGGPYNLALEIARFVAPATTAFSLFQGFRSLVRERLRRRAIAGSVGHAVVTGDSPASLSLAENLRDSGVDVVLVGRDGSEVAQRLGIPVVAGDAREITTLLVAGIRGASTLYACAPHTATNAAVVLAAGDLGGRAPRLEAYAQVRSDELVERLRVRQLADVAEARRVSIDFFSLDDIAARRLLEQYPHSLDSVVIVGFGCFAQALLRALVRRPDPEGKSMTITVYTGDTTQLEKLIAQLERLPNRKIRPSSREPTRDAVKTAGGVFVCLEDEEAAITAALQLATFNDDGVVLCLQREYPFRKALRGTPGLEVFGVLDAACTPADIAADAAIGKAARAIHNSYVESCRERGDTEATNASIRPWAELPLYLRESNYAQAEHIGVKLAAINCTLVLAREAAVPFAFRAGEVDRLAQMEHARWMAERLAAGFVYGPVRGGNEHPDLVDWPDLSDESRSKDTDPVRQLPDLLAAAGLQIQRREARP